MPTICRIAVLAKPSRLHPEYQERETAKIVIFARARSRREAMTVARSVLEEHHWELLGVQLFDRLIGSRVRQIGGDVLDAYETAVTTGASFRIFPENFAPGKDGIPAVRPPRVTGQFIDSVVADVGGVRLVEDNEHRMADYRIGNWLFELKDLQEEGLEQPERQAKLARLFAPYLAGDVPIRLDPNMLPEQDRRKFFDILSSPIQTQVKSASKQIRSTKELLGEPDLEGGIIYLNTGYGSYPDEQFGPMVERYVRKDTTQIKGVFCASTYSTTNGFDTEIFCRLHPDASKYEVVEQLADAFMRRFEEAMTRFVRRGCGADSAIADPLKPLAFRVDGLDYSWQPPVVPKTWEEET
jgi:hypothetical protein